MVNWLSADRINKNGLNVEYELFASNYKNFTNSATANNIKMQSKHSKHTINTNYSIMRFILQVFLHVSTTYCNCNRVYVDEKVYESPISWQDAILIAENLDPKLSETLTTK